jgi:hypothetical protein
MLVLNVKLKRERIATMRNAYVVRELVSVPSGEKELRTHYEYGTFLSYEAANQCAIATRNQSCFPQKEEVGKASWMTRDPCSGHTS